MSDANSQKCNLRLAVTHSDVVQFLYLVRSDMARIVRELEDIGRKLDGMGARRNTRRVPLPKPPTRR
jgi:hypothetical protein